MTTEGYEQDFFRQRHEHTTYAARQVLSLALEALPATTSAVDVGCGVGTWLLALQGLGVPDIQGVDGNWVDADLLVIPQESFRQADLTRPLDLGRRYDVALSLEVAEHLPPESAAGFVDLLVSCSDFVLFSAAIPGQGGTQHLNEQWPAYWAELFEAREYAALDFIRPRIWDDDRIPYWYRQNVLLFARRNRLSEVTPPPAASGPPPALVHPELHRASLREMGSLRGGWRLFARAVRRKLGLRR